LELRLQFFEPFAATPLPVVVVLWKTPNLSIHDVR